ncbi:hypothetical protein C7974DRAFT_303418 [Boeremia exigua]|uniref:uncharacterized protein n=1 Tax=Boeremia exigua TaxID=749465 RepID=UPI001E8EB8CC|nr:uncharacterized protein C7974DRAFT_303418 [Boeremia exigua]KAH6642268.1 hypothetical protein C7974DRAFT_303418 [Boeremia exigua]
MASTNTRADIQDTKIPAWLASHLNIEWSSQDVDALLDSIDASQCPQSSEMPHLPAELLVLILEFVPVAYVLDWRLVCRGFRDAIDGPILFHYLQRTQLVGYLGPLESIINEDLEDEEYEELHLVRADFDSLRDGVPLPNAPSEKRVGPPWSQSHAAFKMDKQWRDRHQWWNDFHSDLPSANRLLSQLEPQRPSQGFGALIWMIQLDTAVLDLEIPLEPGRRTFDVTVDLNPLATSVAVYVEWKPMLRRFLKQERALRRLMEETGEDKVTFGHAEDCLRAVRRQRLHASLNPDQKIDRHIKWSLRLLRPLWGVTARYEEASTLDPVEADAVRVILLLRRAATLTPLQTEHLQRLAIDYDRMVNMLCGISDSVRALRSHLILPGHEGFPYYGNGIHLGKLPLNPIAWSNKQIKDVEKKIQQWKAQESLVTQMQALMAASQEIRLVPEDAFDGVDSEM